MFVCRDDVLLILADAASAAASVPAADEAARSAGGNLHIIVAHSAGLGWLNPVAELGGFATVHDAGEIVRKATLCHLPGDHVPVRCAWITAPSAIADAVEGFLEEGSCRQIIIASAGRTRQSRRVTHELIRVSAPYRVKTVIAGMVQAEQA